MGGVGAGSHWPPTPNATATNTIWSSMTHPPSRAELQRAAMVARAGFRDLTTSAQLERLLELVITTGETIMSAVDEVRAIVAQIQVETQQAVEKIDALVAAAAEGATHEELLGLINELVPVRDALARVTPDDVPAPTEPGPDVDPGSQPVPVDETPVDPDAPVDIGEPAPPQVPSPDAPAPQVPDQPQG